MKFEASRPQKIDKQLEGEPILVGKYSILPRARLSGYVGFGGDENGGGGGWLQLKPQDLIVRAGDGAEERLTLDDPTSSALRGIAATGLAVAMVAWLVIILARISGSKRSAPTNN